MPKAITATAHKLARLIYFMFRYDTEYVAKTQEHYEELHRHRTFAVLTRSAKRLGYIFVPKSPTEPLPSPA